MSEICCDEEVIRAFPGRRRRYAQGLLELAAQTAGMQPATSFAASILGRNKIMLKNRIERIGGPIGKGPITRLQLVLVGLTFLLLLPHWPLLGSTRSNADVQERDRQPDSMAGVEMTSTAPGSLEQHMAYLAADGGHWIADNPSYRLGSDAPRRYIYDVSWGLNRQFAKITIEGEYNDGTRQAYSEVVIFREPKEQRFLFHQYDACGDIGQGETRILADGDEQLDFSKTSVDGKVTTLRYLNVRHNAHSFTTYCFVLQEDNTWLETEKLDWSKIVERANSL